VNAQATDLAYYSVLVYRKDPEEPTGYVLVSMNQD